MFISYRESFLGKKPMQDWNTPKSGWVAVADADDGVWSEDFIRAKDITPDTPTAIFENWACIRSGEDSVRPYEKGGNMVLHKSSIAQKDGWVYYYMRKYNLILAIPSKYSSNMEVTEKVKDYVENCYDTNTFEQIDIKDL